MAAKRLKNCHTYSAKPGEPDDAALKPQYSNSDTGAASMLPLSHGHFPHKSLRVSEDEIFSLKPEYRERNWTPAWQAVGLTTSWHQDLRLLMVKTSPDSDTATWYLMTTRATLPRVNSLISLLWFLSISIMRKTSSPAMRGNCSSWSRSQALMRNIHVSAADPDGLPPTDPQWCFLCYFKAPYLHKYKLPLRRLEPVNSNSNMYTRLYCRPKLQEY